MAYKTKLQVVTKIEKDLDLEEEEFIQPEEMTEYINDALTIVEAYINKLGLRDQYFFTRTTLSLVQGIADYALPANLLEDKIKEIVYSNGVTIYKVMPLTYNGAAEEIQRLNLYNTTEYYQYRIRNDAADSKFLQIIPSSRETVANVLVIEYYRDIARVSLDTDLVEVPEIALQYVYQYVKTMVYEKETHSNWPSSVAKLDLVKELMISTLEGQLADNDNNFVEQDLSIYGESS